ncbi:neutral cholesterol ester hydrolase 1-like protein [Cricetulus griseus]|uniref:Neutral cholesterol ester hydrolase 1-like protein n=1 Tax=Cricetulus griseus TaxID=10029 RepID=A0A061IAW1_CRIGR|nr:neutral cholesterol ester hydrolase 1-like protein [Cricetulus griseus]
MGNKSSKADTPLKCVLKNFHLLYRRKFRKFKSFGYSITKKRLQILCEQEWPTFGVEWPSEGTFDPKVAWAIVDVVYSLPGHLNQIPYIVPWAKATSNPPPWMKTFMVIYGHLHSPLSQLPQSVPQRQPLTQAPPQPQPLKEPPPQPQPLKKPAPQPQPLKKPAPKPQPPTLAPPQPQPLPQPSDACVPFTYTDLYNENTQNPPLRTNPSCITYVPLTTTDLLNWKVQHPPFSTNPKPLISLIEYIFLIHHPTWDDCKLILHVLFTMEERERILTEAAKTLPRMYALTGEHHLPLQRLDWKYRTEESRMPLSDYHHALIEGLKRAARKPTNYSKVSNTRQSRNESPTAFLERLLEAYREYTDIDPEVSTNFPLINLTFVTQSAPDIRRKIERIDGFIYKSRSELLAIAQEVFYNRESEEELLVKKMARIVITAQESGAFNLDQTTYNKNRKPLRRDQCAYCKKLGHWKHECPKQKWDPPVLS